MNSFERIWARATGHRMGQTDEDRPDVPILTLREARIVLFLKTFCNIQDYFLKVLNSHIKKIKISDTKTIEELAAQVADLKKTRSAFENGLALRERRSIRAAWGSAMPKYWPARVKKT